MSGFKILSKQRITKCLVVMEGMHINHHFHLFAAYEVKEIQNLDFCYSFANMHFYV